MEGTAPMISLVSGRGFSLVLAKLVHRLGSSYSRHGCVHDGNIICYEDFRTATTPSESSRALSILSSPRFQRERCTNGKLTSSSSNGDGRNQPVLIGSWVTFELMYQSSTGFVRKC